MRAAIATLLLLLAGGPLLAQDHGHRHGHSPYAGMEEREIKALSNEETADLRAGRGMGLALAAELNGYPGPLHTLELAEALLLTPDQRAATQALFDEMAERAVALGEQVIESERALDHLFAAGHATPEAIAEATAQAGRSKAELRAHHLNYHIEMMAVLDATQIERYRHLRGYRTSPRH